MKLLVPIYALLLCTALKAQPNLSLKQVIQGIVIYSDLQNHHTFYYAPSTLELDKNSDGKPNFSFVRMTHIGGRSRGNENWKQHNMVQFTITPKTITSQKITQIKSTLKKQICQGCKLKLVPMPIKKMDAHLVYIDLETEDKEILNNKYGKEKFEGGIWNTKTFTIRPNKYTTQIIWDGLKRNKGVISIAYGIWGKGKYTDSITYHFTGPKELEEVFKKLNQDSSDTKSKRPEKGLIATGAFPIHVDLEKWPDLLSEISFESTLSPRYGLIDVYCYDFKDQIRPDLIAKIIEFEAKGVRGKKVTAELEFNQDQPNTYAHELRFEYVVRIDKPLRYRVIELTKKGALVEGEWQQKETWNGIIDVSSKIDFDETIKNNKK